MSFIPNKFELLSKLDGLREQAKKKYIDVGGKLLIFSTNTMSDFAKHLIVLQGKDPNVVPQEKIAWKSPATIAAVERAVSDIRPSFNFGGSSRGWSQVHLKNPEKYHPILVGRIRTDQNGVLKVSKESDYMASALKVAEAIEATEKMENYEASRALDLIEASLGISLPQTGSSLEDVNVVSGSRSVSKKEISVKKVAPKKVASKKAAPKKKAVTVRRVKKGVFRRVED